MSEGYKYLGVDGDGEAWGFSHLPEWSFAGTGRYVGGGLPCFLDNAPEWAAGGTLWERTSMWCCGVYLTVHEDLCAWGGYWWKKIADRGVPVDTPDIKQASKDLLGAKRWAGERSGGADKKRGVVLSKAMDIINGERQDQYGSPEDSFEAIADLWEGYFFAKGWVAPANEINARDVAYMMTLFKIARQTNGAGKEDNIVDACGYLAIAADMEEACNNS